MVCVETKGEHIEEERGGHQDGQEIGERDGEEDDIGGGPHGLLSQHDRGERVGRGRDHQHHGQQVAVDHHPQLTR